MTPDLKILIDNQAGLLTDRQCPVFLTQKKGSYGCSFTSMPEEARHYG